jgi:hypothetical protein
MKRILFIVLATALCTGAAFAQDDLAQKVQFHGFVTQGVLLSNNNNYLGANTSDGSSQWTDAALSVSSNLNDKLRGGIQLHFYQLGTFGGDNVQIDWASADYRFNDKVGVRAGKVKTVFGLFNDSQDVDAVHMWALLPEPFYAPDNKSYTLAHYGGDVYGTINLGKKFGKLAYTGYGGEHSVDLNSGYVQEMQDDTHNALTFNQAPSGSVFGGDLRWHLPLQGVLVGASIYKTHITGTGIQNAGGFVVTHDEPVDFYARYEKGKLFVGGEYKRTPFSGTITVNDIAPLPVVVPAVVDQRAWYVMGTYHLLDKLSVGTYYTHEQDNKANTSLSQNYFKDWTISSRYDFNSYFYAKAEGHFIDGTNVGFYTANNPTGVVPKTKLLALKLGFSF